MIERTLSADNRPLDVANLSRLLLALLPGVALTVTIEPFKRERTAKQRASLFGVAYKSLMEQMGLSGASEKDDLHEFLCGEFFGWREKMILGKTRRYPVRTTTRGEDGKRDVLSTREQMEFYAWIQQRAAEHGFDVPDPINPEIERQRDEEARQWAE